MKKFGFGKKLLIASMIVGGTIATTASDLFAETICCYDFVIKEGTELGVGRVPVFETVEGDRADCALTVPPRAVTDVAFSTVVANAGFNDPLKVLDRPDDPNSTQILAGSCAPTTGPKNPIRYRDILAATSARPEASKPLLVLQAEEPKVAAFTVTTEPLTPIAQ